MSDLGHTEPDDLDGCDLEFDQADRTDDDQVDALVMFADVDWYDPAAVEARRTELAAWGDAIRGEP